MTTFKAEWILIAKRSVFFYGKYPFDERGFYIQIKDQDSLQASRITNVPLVEIYSDDILSGFDVDLSSVRCKELRYVRQRPYHIKRKDPRKRYSDYTDEEAPAPYGAFTNAYLPKCDTVPYIRYIEQEICVRRLSFSPESDDNGSNEYIVAFYRDNNESVHPINIIEEYETISESTNKYIPYVYLHNCDRASKDFSWVLCEMLCYETDRDKPIDISCPLLPACLGVDMEVAEHLSQKDGLTIENSTGKIFHLAGRLYLRSRQTFSDPVWYKWFPLVTFVLSHIKSGIYHPGCRSYSIDGPGTDAEVLECFKNIRQISPETTMIMFTSFNDKSVMLKIAKEMLVSDCNIIVYVTGNETCYISTNKVCERIRKIAYLASFLGMDAVREIMSYRKSLLDVAGD